MFNVRRKEDTTVHPPKNDRWPEEDKNGPDSPQAWGPSGDGLPGLDGAFRDAQDLMVVPGVLAGWAMSARVRGDGIPFCDDGARDAPLAGATGLTTAHVNGRDADFGDEYHHT